MARQPKIYTARPAPFVASALIKEKLGQPGHIRQCSAYVVATSKVGAHVLLGAAGIQTNAREIYPATGNQVDALRPLLTEVDTILVSTLNERTGDCVLRVTSPTDVEVIGHWGTRRDPNPHRSVRAWLPELVQVSPCE